MVPGLCEEPSCGCWKTAWQSVCWVAASRRGDSVIIDVDANGQVTVLNGGETVTSNVVAQSTEPQVPAGIS